MAGWAVVQSYSGQEPRAEANLARQAFEYYSPKCEVRQGSRRVVRQLFPSYLFVHVGDHWRSVLSTYGILRVLMSGSGSPALLPQSVIDDLRGRTNDEGVIPLVGSRFFPGQRVVVLRGPFAGCEGVYEGQSGSERCRILLAWLGRATVREDCLDVA